MTAIDASVDDARRVRRIEAGALALGLVIVAASSAWQLGRRPLWIDEAISLGATNQLGRTLTGTGGTMALYYVLLDGWTAVVGTSPVALRSLSVVLVLLTLVVVSRVARRLLPPWPAALAVVITAAMPGMVRMAQDARSYALVTLLTAVGWYALCRIVELWPGPGDERSRSDRPWLWLLAAVGVAGVASQGLFLLQVAPMAVSLLVLPDRGRALLRVGPSLAAGVVATAVVLALGAGSVGDWIPPLALDQLRPAAATLTGAHWSSLTVVGALAVVGIAGSLRRAGTELLDRWRALVPVWWATVPPVALILVSTVRPALLGRYALGSLPGLALLLAVALTWVAGVLPRAGTSPSAGPAPARAVLAVALAVALVAGLAAGRVARTRVTYEDWDAVVALIAEQAQPGDALLFPHATDQTHADTARAPFEAAWSRVESPPVTPVVLSPDRPLGEVRRFDDLVPPGELAQDLVEHPRTWAVEFPSFHRSLKEQLTVAPAAGRVVPVEQWTFDGGIQVLLLERR